METLAWARDLGDLSDLRQSEFESPPAVLWTEQLSPHLQRNRQLQDTLLQREEEVVRLQEENNKLRRFLSSSFVRNLEHKAKNRPLKRNPVHLDQKPVQNRSHQVQTSQQVSKRICRNLTAEFCSASEPNLDLWVLRTLGLKDRDTIDTSGSGSWFRPSVRSSDYPASSPQNQNQNHMTSDLTGLPPTAATRSYGTPVLTQDQTFSSDPVLNQDQTFSSDPVLNQDQTFSPDPVLTQDQTFSPDPVLNQDQTFSPDPVLTQDQTFSPDRAEICSHAVLNPVQTRRSPYWSLRTQFSPGGDPVSVDQLRPPAFRMSLSPSSSVTTHSFPQGQAFVRREPGRRWNFTWVPRQEP